MGLVGSPTATRVTRWPRALPQFTVGHLDRVQAWQERAGQRRSPGWWWPAPALQRARHPGLHRPGPAPRARAARADPDEPTGSSGAASAPHAGQPPRPRAGGAARLRGPARSAPRWSRPDDPSWSLLEPRGPVELAGGPAWFASDDDGPVEAQLVASVAPGAGASSPRRRPAAGRSSCGGFSQGGAVALAAGPGDPAAAPARPRRRVLRQRLAAPCRVDLAYDPAALAAAGHAGCWWWPRSHDEVVLVQQGRSGGPLPRAGRRGRDVRRAARRPRRRPRRPGRGRRLARLAGRTPARRRA